MKYRIDHNFGATPTFHATIEDAIAGLCGLYGGVARSVWICGEIGDGELFVYASKTGPELGMITRIDDKP